MFWDTDQSHNDFFNSLGNSRKLDPLAKKDYVKAPLALQIHYRFIAIPYNGSAEKGKGSAAEGKERTTC